MIDREAPTKMVDKTPPDVGNGGHSSARIIATRAGELGGILFAAWLLIDSRLNAIETSLDKIEAAVEMRRTALDTHIASPSHAGSQFERDLLKAQVRELQDEIKKLTRPGVN